ncbi:MAG: siroheme synthase CysG [Neomegalonema sp.]|nr:siroheme synthase CysG [Neomegalonema sp.]
MKSFPMFIDVANKKVAVFGGGEQAAQKTRLLLKTEAKPLLVADILNDELSGVVAQGRAEHAPMASWAQAVQGARFAFIASGCAGADAAAAAIAKGCGVMTNVVDRPELCDLTTPAIVDRDPVVVAIGTEGAAPVLARGVKTRIEQLLEPRLGDLAAYAGRIRAAVAQKVPRARHRAFWAWVFGGAPRRAFAKGEEDAATRLIAEAVEKGGEIVASNGLVSLVGAGPGSPDLLTLRAVQRLQEADVIYYDRLVDERVLELARRDAERIYVGKKPGAHSWPQARISRAIAAEGEAGKRVVRLKCGDPLVFGRAAEEAEALEAAGVAWEVIPGVTAASAAAAEAKFFPTERGVSRSMTYATGMGADGKLPADIVDTLRPGGTTVFYMCVATSPRIVAELLAAGAPAACEALVAEAAETPRRRFRRTTLGALEEQLWGDEIKSPAVVFIRWPSKLAAAERKPALARAIG